MSTLPERIKECARIAGNGNELARKARIPRSSLENYLNGNREIKASALGSIAQATGVDPGWLLTGSGTPYGISHATDASMVVGSQTSLALHEDFEMIHFYSPQPAANAVEDYAAAYKASAVLQFSKEWLRRELRVLPIDVCLWSIDSDTMTPTLTPGDLALIDRRKDHIGLDGVYLLSMNGSASLKRLQALPGGVVKVTHDNTVYEPFTLQLNQLNTNDIDLVGKVIWIGHQFR